MKKVALPVVSRRNLAAVMALSGVIFPLQRNLCWAQTEASNSIISVGSSDPSAHTVPLPGIIASPVDITQCELAQPRCLNNQMEKLWSQKKIGADAMARWWEEKVRSGKIPPAAEIRVAVVDTGFDIAGRNSLMQRPVTISAGYQGSRDGSVDEAGHGTLVASLIGGRDGVGVSPHSKITMVSVTRPDTLNGSSDSDRIFALERACAEGHRVLNLSWEMSRIVDELPLLNRILAQRGCLMVWASGNSGRQNPQNMVSVPEGILSVGAHRYSGAKTTFTNLAEVYAPGELVYTFTTSFERSTRHASRFNAKFRCQTGRGPEGADQGAFVEGTSIAAPLVAGIAAETMLFLEQSPRFRRLQPYDQVRLVKQIILKSEWNGEVNGWRALRLAEAWSEGSEEPILTERPASGAVSAEGPLSQTQPEASSLASPEAQQTGRVDSSLDLSLEVERLRIRLFSPGGESSRDESLPRCQSATTCQEVSTCLTAMADAQNRGVIPTESQWQDIAETLQRARLLERLGGWLSQGQAYGYLTGSPAMDRIARYWDALKARWSRDPAVVSPRPTEVPPTYVQLVSQFSLREFSDVAGLFGGSRSVGSESSSLNSRVNETRMIMIRDVLKYGPVFAVEVDKPLRQVLEVEKLFQKSLLALIEGLSSGEAEQLLLDVLSQLQDHRFSPDGNWGIAREFLRDAQRWALVGQLSLGREPWRRFEQAQSRAAFRLYELMNDIPLSVIPNSHQAWFSGIRHLGFVPFAFQVNRIIEGREYLPIPSFFLKEWLEQPVAFDEVKQIQFGLFLYEHFPTALYPDVSLERVKQAVLSSLHPFVQNTALRVPIWEALVRIQNLDLVLEILSSAIMFDLMTNTETEGGSTASAIAQRRALDQFWTILLSQSEELMAQNPHAFLRLMERLTEVDPLFVRSRTARVASSRPSGRGSVPERSSAAVSGSGPRRNPWQAFADVDWSREIQVPLWDHVGEGWMGHPPFLMERRPVLNDIELILTLAEKLHFLLDQLIFSGSPSRSSSLEPSLEQRAGFANSSLDSLYVDLVDELGRRVTELTVDQKARWAVFFRDAQMDTDADTGGQAVPLRTLLRLRKRERAPERRNPLPGILLRSGSNLLHQ